MEIIKTDIEGVLILKPHIFGDARGYFYESYNKKLLSDLAPEIPEFVQDNQSYSTYGVVRGLHFQKAPYAQAKLVRVVSGKVLDVAVDLRAGSPTFGKHVSVELSGEISLEELGVQESMMPITEDEIYAIINGGEVSAG